VDDLLPRLVGRLPSSRVRGGDRRPLTPRRVAPITWHGRCARYEAMFTVLIVDDGRIIMRNALPNIPILIVPLKTKAAPALAAI